MDLVKIGFLIQAEGLKEANQEVDTLLAKVEKIGSQGKKAGTDFESGQKKIQGSAKESEKVVLSASEKMLKKQELLTKFLPQMDKQTANLATSFSLVSDNVEDLNRFLNMLTQNKALIQAKKDVEDLQASQRKQIETTEKLRQQAFSREQQDYQKRMQAAKDAEVSSAQAAESARQKKLKAEQDYYQKQMALQSASAAASQKAQAKLAADAETARQKKFKADQDYYQKTLAHAQSLKDVEAQRLKQQQRAIDLTNKSTSYKQQGFSATNATKLATMELSGADKTTLDNYKTALLNAQNAMKGLSDQSVTAAKNMSFWNTQVGGIVKYALLSAAIYGVMTAMVNLGVAIVKTADEYTSIQNRMKLYISDANELARVNEKLAQYSMANNVGLRETSTLFARLAPSMQKIGANTAAVTTVVDAFGKSMRIGGATTQEAASATLQFSQAMASGKLNGDEFRAISEASPRFLKAIADGSGIAAEKLKEMSSAGALTTEVISKALIKEYARLSAENEKLGFTLEQGANAMKTAFTVMLGEFNEGAGITQFFGTQMMNLASGLMTAAGGAKEFGSSVKQWFTDNKDTIESAGKALEIFIYLVGGKLVAGYVVAAASAIQAARANITLTASQLGVSKSAAASIVMQQRLTTAYIQVGAAAQTAGNLAKTAFAFLGGWVGLIATVVSATAAYLFFNKANAATAESFRQEGESIQATIDKYKELSKVKQQSTLDSEVANLKELNAAYKDSKESLIANVLNLSRSNDMTSAQAKSMAILAMQYKQGNISVEQLVASVSKAGYVSEDSKVKTRSYAASVVEAGEKAGFSKDLIAKMRQEIAVSGEKAAFAKTGVDAFTKGLEDQAKKLRETTKLAKSYGLEIQSAAKLQAELTNRFGAKETALAAKKTYYEDMQAKAAGRGDSKTAANWKTAANSLQTAQNYLLQAKAKTAAELAKGFKELDAADKEQSDYTASLRKAEKDADKAGNTKQKNKKRYTDQVQELSKYISLLEQAENIDVARIASEKEYQNAFGTNLDQAKQLYELQRQASQIEARAEYMKSLAEETEAQERLVALMNLGLNIDEAKALVQAKFTDNAKGRAAAELQLTNEAYEQHYAMASQIKDQTAINTMLAQGYDLEAAIFRLKTSKVRGLSGKADDLDDLDAEYDKQVKLAQAAQVQADTLVKINALNREGRLLAAATANGYTNAALAAAELAGATQGMSLHLATSLMIKQDQVALDKELAQNAAGVLTYLEGESAVLRDIKNTYTTIKPEAAKALEIERKRLDIMKAYAEKKEAEKDTPFGDFSKVDFSVFGDFGNPFQTALEGLNEFVAGNTKLNESLGIIGSQMDALKAKAASPELFGNEEAVKKINAEVSALAAVEKDYLDQKANAQDKAWSQGLGLAKSFFKENSKGYKTIAILEQAMQAKKIAFMLWEKKDKIQTLALTLGGYVKEAIAFVTGATTKVAAQSAVNVAKGTEAILTQGSGDPYTAFGRMAAMAAIVAGLGIAISGSFGGSSSGTQSFENTGTGTVFGGAADDKSASIANAIDILADNSELGLPISSAMLRSVQNIESAMGGVANLLIRQGTGSGFASNFGSDAALNPLIDKAHGLFTKITGTAEKVLTGGLLKLNLGSNIIGKLLGGIFGKVSQEVTGSGIYGGTQTLGSILSGGMQLHEYADVTTTKKSWFGSKSSNSTVFKEASAELENQFSLIFGGVFDSILAASGALGRDESQTIEKLLSSNITLGKINTQGKTGKEIQELLEGVIGQQADIVAKEAVAGLDDFQKVGEGYYETLVRVATGVEEAAYYTDRLHVSTVNYTDLLNKQGDVAAEIVRQSVLLTEGTKDIKGGVYDLISAFDGTAGELTDFIFTLRDLQDQLFMTGKNADYLTSSMILGAGGLGNLSNGLDAYFEMLSPAEQAAELTRRLTNEFSIFGKELPADTKAFRALISGIDISTEAGQKLYGQIIALAPEFNDLQDAINDANSDVNALVKSLRDLADQARAARGETNQPSNLDYLRNDFNTQSLLAMQGDTAAAEKLLTLGKDLMSLSKQYSVDGSEYARDLALIQRAASASADAQEAGLGYTTPKLNPLINNATDTVLATTNTATDAKLDALREDMITAITAVAKYTQDTANRLERWDYGDRMNVRVDQDTGETVPVKVIP